jgi:hypothetical protein
VGIFVDDLDGCCNVTVLASVFCCQCLPRETSSLVSIYTDSDDRVEVTPKVKVWDLRMAARIGGGSGGGKTGVRN